MPISVKSPRELNGVAAPLRSLVTLALRAEGARPGEIGVTLADDALLRTLNRQYRGIDRATDVLSFPYGTAQGIHGDIVISMDRMHDQARRFRVSPGKELARLVVHGALHLTGHDHHRASERLLMRRAESTALRQGRAIIARLDAALRA